MKLSKDDQKVAKTIMNDPVVWASKFVKLPSGEYFKPSFVQDKIFSASKNKVVVCVHRRAGKTYALAIIVLWLLFTHPNCKIIFLAPGEPQIEKFYQTLDELLGANPMLSACIGVNKNSPYRRSVIQGNGKESYIWGFVAQKGSKSVRGQEADYILIDECDFIEADNWASITPVIEGDRFRKVKPVMYATSTPGDSEDSLFMKWVANTENNPEYDIIHVPITENEEYTQEEIERIEALHRQTGRMAEFEREYLLKIGFNSNKQVFQPRFIERSARLNDWEEITYGPARPYPDAIYQLPKKREGEIRVVAVDWDRVQAGPSILIAQYLPKDPYLRVLWREEIDKNTDHLFTWTCQYLLDIHKHVQWDHLMSEATRDTMQIETLHLMARQQNPQLIEKIHDVDFNSNYETRDAQNKEVIKRRLKQMMVGNLQKLFEDDRILIPKGDAVLKKQLQQYKILNFTERGPSYSKENEHFIDTLGMAAWAFFKYYDNPFKIIPVTKVVAVPRYIDEAEYQATARTNIPKLSRLSGITMNPNLNTRRSWGTGPVRSKF